MAERPIDSPESLSGWPMPWPRFAVDWRRAALLLVDLQNYGCHPEIGLLPMFALRYPEVHAYYGARIAATVLPNAKRLLEAFRGAKREAIYTRHGPLLPDGRDMIARRRVRDADSLESLNKPTLWHKGTPEHAIVDALAPREGELVIDKNTSSAFNSTGIEFLLTNMRIETLIIAGMATEMCVEATARDAADRGWNVILVEDATATFYPEHHRASLSAFARVFGKVWTTERVLTELEQSEI
jgi:biuret amidohydrolase